MYITAQKRRSVPLLLHASLFICTYVKKEIHGLFRFATNLNILESFLLFLLVFIRFNGVFLLVRFGILNTCVIDSHEFFYQYFLCHCNLTESDLTFMEESLVPTFQESLPSDFGCTKCRFLAIPSVGIGHC